jgi:outer membrane beta-barrel protein
MFLSKIKIIFAVIVVSSLAFAVDEEDPYQQAEIRVMRPRYFNKKFRFEFGSQLVVVTNQTFYYTSLLNLSAGFHFNELFGLELTGAYGLSHAKEDHAVLDDEFNIKPQFAPIERYYGGSFLWTPMYGKYQLRNGHLVYFDTFLSFGAGIVGVLEKYQHCPTSNAKDNTVYDYPYFAFGVGQRFFLSKNDSVRWDIKAPMFYSDTANESCFEDAEGERRFNNNINFQLGYSRFL